MNRRQRGYILILTVTVIAVLVVFAIAYVNYFRGEKKSSQQEEFILIAQSAADAGINDAVSQINKDKTWGTHGETMTKNLPGSGATYTVTFVRNTADPDRPGQFLPYSINNLTGIRIIRTGWPGNRFVPPGGIHLVSVGRFRNTTRTSLTQVEEAMVTSGTILLFPGAAAVQHGITMTGGITTDSYNSSVNAYENTSPKGANGDLFTNSGYGDASSMQPPYVSIKGNSASIGGTITYVGANPVSGAVDAKTSVYLNDQGTSPGAPILSPSPIQFPPITIPTNPAPLPFLSTYINGTAAVPSGTYIINDLTMQGNNEIKLALETDPKTGKQTFAKVTLYVTGTIKISGSTMVNGYKDVTTGHGNSQVTTREWHSGIPGNFMVYSTGTTLEFSGGSPVLFWSLYAPKAEVKVSGTPTVYGSISANAMTGNGNMSIHYDEALGNLSTPPIYGNVTFRSEWSGVHK